MTNYVVALVALVAMYSVLIYGGVRLLVAVGVLPPRFLHSQKPQALIHAPLGGYSLLAHEPLWLGSGNTTAYDLAVGSQYHFTTNNDEISRADEQLAAITSSSDDREPAWFGSGGVAAFEIAAEPYYAVTKSDDHEQISNYVVAHYHVELPHESGLSDSFLTYAQYPKRTRAESAREAA